MSVPSAAPTAMISFFRSGNDARDEWKYPITSLSPSKTAPLECISYRGCSKVSMTLSHSWTHSKAMWSTTVFTRSACNSVLMAILFVETFPQIMEARIA
ncbi:hypothetical protein D3C81_1984360 [compost metagenome]